MTDTRDDAAALVPEIVALRRAIHAEPELAWKETRTAARVAAFLEGHGLALRTGVGGTGVLADVSAERTVIGERGEALPRRAVDVERPGRGVLLRVDMDALPLQEENAAPYASRVPNTMHACGHDGHVAMGAGAARLLAGRDLPGRVRMLFQPAEEGEGGAQAVVDEALRGMDSAFGVHLWNELPVGVLGVKAGPLMAAVDRLQIVVRGRGGHGGKPHRSADPVVAAAYVVTALQTIVSREVAPVQAAVVTIGAVHGGQAFNVIPEEVVLTGTIRTFDADLRRSMPERITRLVRGVAEGLQCTATVEVRAGNPPVMNDAGAAEIARRAAARVVGEANVVSPEPTMGGEDMAIYFERVPGCFVFVGSSNAARGLDQPHHSPRFDFDEDALLIGTRFLVAVAEEALGAT